MKLFITSPDLRYYSIPTVHEASKPNKFDTDSLAHTRGNSKDRTLPTKRSRTCQLENIINRPDSEFVCLSSLAEQLCVHRYCHFALERDFATFGLTEDSRRYLKIKYCSKPTNIPRSSMGLLADLRLLIFFIGLKITYPQ